MPKVRSARLRQRHRPRKFRRARLIWGLVSAGQPFMRLEIAPLTRETLRDIKGSGTFFQSCARDLGKAVLPGIRGICQSPVEGSGMIELRRQSCVNRLLAGRSRHVIIRSPPHGFLHGNIFCQPPSFQKFCRRRRNGWPDSEFRLEIQCSRAGRRVATKLTFHLEHLPGCQISYGHLLGRRGSPLL